MVNYLRIERLTKSYKNKPVFHDLSLNIASSEIVGLLGPNGAGKTTFFYTLLGLVHADTGDIFLNDEKITYLKIHERARRGIGYLPQEASIFRKLTVYENILAVLELRRDLTTVARRQQAEELLQEFRVEHLRDQLGLSLSGGERRRVEVARALALAPKFILLDEPFAGVDPISVGDIKQIVQKVHEKGIGVIITDHNVRETLGICHCAYILNQGELVAHGSPAEILANQAVREFYLGEEFSIN